MKRIFALLTFCLLCSCSKSEEPIWSMPEYDVSTISLSHKNLVFNIKADGITQESITIDIDSTEDIPTDALYISTSDPDVITFTLSDEGEIVVTPVAAGVAEIYVALQDKIVSCSVEVRDYYFAHSLAAVLKSDYDFTLDDDGDIDIYDSATQDLIAELKDLDVSQSYVTSLAGIEYLTALESLDCHDRYLTLLDVSECVNLETLYCSGNTLTELDVTKCVNLKDLDCSNNFLTELDVTKCMNLEILCCNSNSLPQLDVSRCVNLKNVECYSNSITQLDVTKCTKLVDLRCSDNYLTELDVTKCTLLTILYCNSNFLTELDIAKCPLLTILYCNYNLLTELDVAKCTLLTTLYCYSNSLTVLDVTKCTSLTYLHCYSNSLTELDVTECASLNKLYCGNQNEELTLYVTTIQKSGTWDDLEDDYRNAGVTTTTTDGRS